MAVFAPLKEVDQQMAMMYMQQGMQPPAPQDQYTRVMELLQQGHYEPVRIELTEASPVPDDVDALIVMALTPLQERQVYEINRVLRRGVPVVMGLQAHEYGYSPAPSGGWSISGQGLDTGLEPMLAAFGVTVSEDHFMDSAMETIDLPREVNLGGLRMQTREPVRIPLQIRVTESQMNQDAPLVNRIGSLFYLWGTPVVTDPETLGTNALKATTLISSSDDCWQQTWNEGPIPGSTLNPSGKTMLGSQPLAVLLEGGFPDTFEGKPVPPWPASDQEETADPLAAGPEAPPTVDPQPGSLLLVGCAKMFDDNIIGAAQNPLLLLNAVDFLAGSQELLSIRAKTLTQRVIKPVDDKAKVMWRLIVVLLVPVLLATYGVMRAGVRRKEATRYRENLRRLSGATR